MLQACRPAGRLFYLGLAVVVGLSVGVGAREDGSGERPGKSGSVAGAKAAVAAASPRAGSPALQSGPTLTSVVDSVYRADGSAAQGVLVITWPAFVAANGVAVAGGTLNVTLGANGALNVALASNAGANPPGAYYSVVYQLGPGQVKTEYWVVPTSSPATLAQVRTTPGSGTAAAGASVQYVNTALAGKANDNAVVHISGAETISGNKTFAAPPNVPTPVGTGDVTNKSYVDSAIAAVGAGNYLPTAGGAMTGALTLNGNPTSPLQASPKQYVDLTAAGKADLVDRVGADERTGKWNAFRIELFVGKRGVGTVRLERERDGDSKCAGSVGCASERTSADVFVGIRAIRSDHAD